MNIKNLVLGAVLVQIISFGIKPQAVLAEESSSFRLYHEFPQYGERGPEESDSFRMNEDGITWSAKPLIGSSYRIVTAPPEGAQDEVPPVVPSAEADETAPVSGGHRGQGTLVPRLAAPSEPPLTSEPTRPSAPEAPLEVPAFEGVEFMPPKTKPLYDEGVDYPRGERRLAPLHYFHTVGPGKEVKYVYVKEEVLSHEAAAMIERGRLVQIALMLTQAIAALCFLLAFKLLLKKVPKRFLK